MTVGDLQLLWAAVAVAVFVGWPVAKAQDICSCQNSAYPNERCCKPDGSSCWPGGTVTTVNGGFKCYDPAYPVGNCGSGLFQYEAPTCITDPTPPAPVCQCANSTYPDDRCCTTDGTCKPETLGGAAPTVVSGGFSCLDPAYPAPMCAASLFDVQNYYTYQCPTCNPTTSNCVPPTASTSTDSTTTPATTATTTTVAVAATTTAAAEATTTTSPKTTTAAAQPEATTSPDYPDMTITFSQSAATLETTTAGATTKEQGSSTTPIETTTVSDSTTEPPMATTAGDTTTDEATTTAGTTSVAETTTTADQTTSSAAETTTAEETTTEEARTTTELPTTSTILTTKPSGPCCGTWSAWTFTTTCAAGGQLRYVSNAEEDEEVSKHEHLSLQPPTNPIDSCVALTTPPASCCGTWSAWTVTVGCPSGSCGACQTRTKTRTCLTSEACPCKGPTTITEPCSTTPCAYPKDSCCGSYTAKSVGTAIVCAGPSPPSTGTCVPSTTVPTPRTTLATTVPPSSAPSKCCPTGGIWSEWGPRLNCTDTCGAFGTAVRLRTCLTSAGGCSCAGSARSTVSCAFSPCIYPRNSCASGFKASKRSGKIRCVANVPPPAENVQPADCCPKGGVWTQWSAWSTCTTKCGSCSRVERTRNCASKRYGCPCAKNATTVAQRRYCNTMPCSYPEEACCSPFKVKSMSGKLQCV